MTTKLLDKLQEAFECQKCGTCCAFGGDMELTADEVGAITVFIGEKKGLVQLDMFTPVPFKPGYFMLTHRLPCCFYDQKAKTCIIHEVRPQACHDYPFKLFADGKCTLAAVSVCKGASKVVLDEFFTDNEV